MQRRTARRWVQASVIGAALSAGFLSGCGGDDDPSPQAVEEPVDEVAAHDGKVCPDRLPRTDAAEAGLGADRPAARAPKLPAIEEAWVCEYSPAAADPGPEGNGDPWVWELAGDVSPVDAAALPDIEADVAELTPQSADLVCTADLGPRWMLVYSTGNNLTGVAVDDFGCRTVLLTDEPFETAPGAASDSGIESGALSAPDSLLDQLRAAGA